MKSPDFWRLAYHFCGVTLLGQTKQQALGCLPVPLRSAALLIAHEVSPQALELEVLRKPLTYAAGHHNVVRSWRLVDQRLKALVGSRDSKPQVRFTSLNNFFEKYGMLKPMNDTQDEHFAERLFLEEAFVPVFGLAGLTRLTPQRGLKDRAGKERKLDFLLEGAKNYALEVEGYGYHAKERIGKERFDDEKRRQRTLADTGYTYYPFSLGDIRSGKAEEVLNDLCFDDSVLDALRGDRQTSVQGGELLLERLLSALPFGFQRYQKLALALLSAASDRRNKTLVVVEHEPTLPLLTLALIDTLALCERVAQLYGMAVHFPKLELHVVGTGHDSLVRDLLDRYKEVTKLDAPHTTVRVIFGDEFTDSSKAFEYRNSDTRATDLLISQFTASLGLEPPLHAQPVNVERPIIDYFARRYFLVPEVKAEQLQLLQQTLRGVSSLGLLPTGFGKSLVFQLYAVMVPRVTLVVSPLKALIRDQMHALHSLGLSSVASITSQDTAAQKAETTKRMHNHQVRMVYVSPERLQIKGFYDELRATMSATPIGALIIDEAHCVSEWGHDFRPAYLQIGRLRRTLEAASGRPVTILALTATASKPVRDDIVHTLGLELKNVEQLASSDRPNLSLSVHPVSLPSEKPRMVAKLVRKDIPNLLRIDADAMLQGAGNRHTHAGIVFGMYANAHGRRMLPESVHYIAHHLRQHLGLEESLVQVHASTAPSLCPECGSNLYTSMSASEAKARGVSTDGRSAFSCQACDSVFARPTYVSDWDKTILKRQDNFKDNTFPVLVATKGYGMGIDKSNIRLIVHNALSSGLEGYYQEAGRAGRDGEHAHVALVYAEPHKTCSQEYLELGTPPPCVSVPNNYRFWKCPYMEHLCDFGHQARFIQGNYPGEVKDATDIMNVYQKLEKKAALKTGNDEESQAMQLALYRLQQLGLVETYTLKYQTLRDIQFDVEYAKDWTHDNLLETLSGWLKNTGVDASTISKSLKKHSLPDLTDNREVSLHHAVETLLERVYQTIPKMRFQMLTNQLRYATSQTCRRVIIRGVFDTIDHLALDYKCGFCDRCVPDLHFTQTLATTPMRDIHVDELASRLPQMLERFDHETLTSAVQLGINKGANEGLLARVTGHLEHEGTNVAALYMAGALARRSAERQREAFGYLRYGFEEGERQGLTPENLLAFYEEAVQVDPAQAFALLDRQDGAFSAPAHLDFLCAEAERTLGSSAAETKAVYQLRDLRSARGVARDVANLNIGLERLLAGFTAMTKPMARTGVL